MLTKPEAIALTADLARLSRCLHYLTPPMCAGYNADQIADRVQRIAHALDTIIIALSFRSRRAWPRTIDTTRDDAGIPNETPPPHRIPSSAFLRLHGE